MREGVRGPDNSDYTQTPEGYHDQEDGLDPVPAAARDRPSDHLRADSEARWASWQRARQAGAPRTTSA